MEPDPGPSKSSSLGFVEDVADVLVGPSKEANRRLNDTNVGGSHMLQCSVHPSFSSSASVGRMTWDQPPNNSTMRPHCTCQKDRLSTCPTPAHTWDSLWMHGSNGTRIFEGSKPKRPAKIGALASLAGSTWGACLLELRQVYHVMVVPQITYGCSAWFIPDGGHGFK